MSSKKKYSTISIIGAGSFGTVMANLAANNAEKVLVYARSEKRIKNFNTAKINNGYKVAKNVTATTSVQEICSQSTIVVSVIPSKNFREVMQQFSPYLHPNHIMIHGTKGVDIQLENEKQINEVTELSRDNIFTMSEVIRQETCIRRIGCIAGPNLSKEIANNQPAGAIIASNFNEVITLGKQLFTSRYFKVFSSTDILGAEFSGVLKNIFAIASGILHGLGFGNNARALLITKGLHEMLFMGNKMGGNTNAFLGIAGIGDLVATCSSELSRNFTVGKRIAQGESIYEIITTETEVAEGIRSIQIFYLFCNTEKISAPITDMLYRVLFEQMQPLKAVEELMAFKYNSDVSFL